MTLLLVTEGLIPVRVPPGETSGTCYITDRLAIHFVADIQDMPNESRTARKE